MGVWGAPSTLGEELDLADATLLREGHHDLAEQQHLFLGDGLLRDRHEVHRRLAAGHGHAEQGARGIEERRPAGSVGRTPACSSERAVSGVAGIVASRVTGVSCWFPSTKYTRTGSVAGRVVVVGSIVVVVCGGRVVVVVVLVVVVSARSSEGVRVDGAIGVVGRQPAAGQREAGEYEDPGGDARPGPHPRPAGAR